MFKDPKVQGATGFFVLFFIVCAMCAWKYPELRQQFFIFIFSGLTTTWAAILLFIKPDGGINKPATPVDPSPDAGLLQQPSKEI